MPSGALARFSDRPLDMTPRRLGLGFIGLGLIETCR